MAATASKNKVNTINIKSQPMQMHISSSKYTNDDWGTMAFILDRREIQKKFLDKELRYNCIYFLFGFVGDNEVCYVGQAKKRNDGESVLKRLREHDTSTTEPYRDKWDWAVVVTNKDDSWTLDDLNALEHAFYLAIPAEQNLNGNTPNAGGADFDSYIDKIIQIKSLVTAIGFSIFEDKEADEAPNIQVTSETNEYSIVEDLQNGMARIPEIVTPHKTVKQMVDMLPAEAWNDKTVFLDPACKGGEYLREIYDRLMENELLQANYPNAIERSNHILQEQIYGIALSQVSLERTTKKLLGYGQNIRVIPNYIDILKGKGLGSHPDGKQMSIKDILNKEFGKAMKIDVVIGNPPYQEESGGRNARPLYNDFVMNLYDTAAHYICFIHPSRWVSGGIGLDKFRDWMLENDSIKYLRDFRDASNIFRGVLISGGVMYYLIDKNYHGVCNIEYTDQYNNKSSNKRKLNEYDIYVRDNNALQIIRKTASKRSLASNMSNLNPFGIDADIRGTKEPSIVNCYKLLSSGGYGYISKDFIPSGHNYLPYYKTVVAKALSSKPGKIQGTIAVLEPNDVCTFSYFIAGISNEWQVCANIEKYLKTRLLRFLLFITTASINTSKRNYMFVPLQDFTSNSDIDWSQSIADIDNQLYKKYGLTQEEIDYIEKTIKPME